MMNILSTLKTLPLLGILATSITLAPDLVHAENKHRMQQNNSNHAYRQQHVHNEQYRPNKSKGHKHKHHRMAHSHDWQVQHNHSHYAPRPYVEHYTIEYDNSYPIQHQTESDHVRLEFGMRSDNFSIYIRE
jgi:outer membrane cobalamin receptor